MCRLLALLFALVFADASVAQTPGNLVVVGGSHVLEMKGASFTTLHTLRTAFNGIGVSK